MEGIIHDYLLTDFEDGSGFGTGYADGGGIWSLSHENNYEGHGTTIIGNNFDYSAYGDGDANGCGTCSGCGYGGKEPF